MRGYGQRFEQWLVDDQFALYTSSGNGAASAPASHDHPEAVKGAQAIQCFLEADGYDEETLRDALSLGGDADTLCAMAGALRRPTGAAFPLHWPSRCSLTAL